MPKATNAYGFEWKVYYFASGLSADLAGDPFVRFSMVFDEKGVVQTIQFNFERKENYELGTSYLFYDPFEPKEYCFLTWQNVDRSTMERLIRQEFQNSDFVKNSTEGRDLETPFVFPTSWGVMF